MWAMILKLRMRSAGIFAIAAAMSGAGDTPPEGEQYSRASETQSFPKYANGSQDEEDRVRNACSIKILPSSGRNSDLRNRAMQAILRHEPLHALR